MIEHRQACNPELIKAHEEMLTETKISLRDFIDRYDKDREECRQRYKEDREEARQWREHFDRKLSDIEIFIAQMKPNYKFAIYFIGTIVMGSLGLIFKLLWDHATDVAATLK